MDLERMLDKCRRFQWRVDDLDWSVTPRALSKDDEIAICQYFTDMAGIERLAKGLFEVQRDRTDNPILKKIFSTFVVDEERHAVAAERLAAHYDLNHYRQYEQTPALRRFTPHFVDAIRYVPAEVANIYITSGELLLDVALLRAIDDYVDDDMSRQVMHLINRDESRHIAIDYHMVEYYASPAYQQVLRAQGMPSPRLAAKATWAMLNVLYHSRPFVHSVFFTPMSVVDPDSARMKEAFKRIQLLGKKPGVAKRPFARFIAGIQTAYNTRVGRLLFGNLLSRVAGVPEEMLVNLHTEEEVRRVAEMSYDELAEEALAAKHLH